MRIAFLGPAGTFTEDALQTAVGHSRAESVALPTVHDVIDAVESGDAELALVPFENSIEGSVRSVLDALAFDAPRVRIVGEYDHPVSHGLIARRELPLDRVEAVLSHPQASAQCMRFLRENLPNAEIRPAPSTAEAVRRVSESPASLAALGAPSAAKIYGCVVLREGVEDVPDNVTRFVWLAPRREPADAAADAGKEPAYGAWRTSLVFSELGDDRPGALVEALLEFSRREVNLTRIESRPLRQGLGRYMFFVDLEGSAADGPVADAISALRAKAESVRVIGSYPLRNRGIPTGMPPAKAPRGGGASAGGG